MVQAKEKIRVFYWGIATGTAKVAVAWARRQEVKGADEPVDDSDPVGTNKRKKQERKKGYGYKIR